ncbi:MAG: cytochrome c3 family protein [Phycisphaerales bacterium]
MRPLSERFNLMYVRKKHFADAWTGRLGFVAAAATALTVGAYQMSGDDRPYTAGPLTKAHDMFASDCTKCHEASMEKGLRGFLMPASDEMCIKCHANQAGLHAENQIDLFTASMPGHPEMRTSANCAACHMEHLGRDHNLLEVSDQTCVKCHEDLAAKGIRRVLASNTPPAAAPPEPPVTEPSPAATPVPAGTEGGAK